MTDRNSAAGRILATKEAPIGWLVFDNPGRRNAVSLDMWKAIPGVLEDFGSDPDVRVVVVTGAGSKSFVSGADISEFGDKRATTKHNEEYAEASKRARDHIHQLEKPTVAMINGFCIGGGIAVMLSCDFRVAAEDARFSIPAAKLGLGYSLESIRLLVTAVGPGNAKEMLFTGRQFSAAEAYRMGLLNAVVTSDQLEPAVREYVGMVAENAPLTIRAGKLAIDGVSSQETQDVARLNAAIDACVNSMDYIEGRNAFAEKRPPKFTGR